MSLSDRLAAAIATECPEAEPWADRIAAAVVVELDQSPGAMFGLVRDDGEALFDEYSMLSVASIDDWEPAVDDARRDVCGDGQPVQYRISRYVPAGDAVCVFDTAGEPVNGEHGLSLAERRQQTVADLIVAAYETRRRDILAHSTVGCAADQFAVLDAEFRDRCRLFDLDADLLGIGAG